MDFLLERGVDASMRNNVNQLSLLRLKSTALVLILYASFLLFFSLVLNLFVIFLSLPPFSISFSFSHISLNLSISFSSTSSSLSSSLRMFVSLSCAHILDLMFLS